MELNNAVTTKDEKYTIRDNPSVLVAYKPGGCCFLYSQASQWVILFAFCMWWQCCLFVPGLKILLDTHGKSKVADGTAVIAQASAVDVLEAKQQQMESQAFDLTMVELEFDLQSFRVYQQKVVNARSSRARCVQEWASKSIQASMAAAEAYFDTHVAWCEIVCGSVAFLWHLLHSLMQLMTVFFQVNSHEVSNLVWENHDTGAVAITAYKEERVSRTRQLGIPSDGMAACH